MGFLKEKKIFRYPIFLNMIDHIDDFIACRWMTPKNCELNVWDIQFVLSYIHLGRIVPSILAFGPYYWEDLDYIRFKF